MANDMLNVGLVTPLLGGYRSRLAACGTNVRKPTGSQYVMYCCPFCGGRFPIDRSMWVPFVPDDERVRMNSRIAGLNSVAAIMAVLGPPDYDQHVSPSNDRNIEYYNHSEWFNVGC